MDAGSYSRCGGSLVMDGYLSLPLVLGALRIAGLPVVSGARLQGWETLPWTSVMQNQTWCEPSHHRLKSVESFREWSSNFIASNSHFQTIMPDIIANIHSWVSMTFNELPNHQLPYLDSEMIVHHIRGGYALWEIKLKVFSHTERTCWGHQDFAMCSNSLRMRTYEAVNVCGTRSQGIMGKELHDGTLEPFVTVTQAPQCSFRWCNEKPKRVKVREKHRGQFGPVCRPSCHLYWEWSERGEEKEARGNLIIIEAETRGRWAFNA